MLSPEIEFEAQIVSKLSFLVDHIGIKAMGLAGLWSTEVARTLKLKALDIEVTGTATSMVGDEGRD